MKLNHIFNEDCFVTMKRHIDVHSVNVVLTSPPYNTMRDNRMYDVYADNLTDEEYINWTIELFDLFERVLAKNGVVLYNINYGSENSVNLLWNLISDVIRYTDFMVADQIIWKKQTAMPNSMSSNKLTRIFENVFVFCRKSEYDTFQSNKKLNEHTGRYKQIYNIVEARNNDGSVDLNKATFSSELVVKLLKIYALRGNIVYDPFMGTGTTAVGVRKIGNLGLKYIGSELSDEQVAYANKRINQNNKLF